MFRIPTRISRADRQDVDVDDRVDVDVLVNVNARVGVIEPRCKREHR